jgi:hypothetical protein
MRKRQNNSPTLIQVVRMFVNQKRTDFINHKKENEGKISQ